MRTLIFTIDYRPLSASGIATYTHEIATQLVNLGEDIIILAPHLKGDVEFDRQQNFKIIRFINLSIIRDLVLFFYFPYIVKKFNIERIFNIMWFPCGWLSFIFSKVFKFPYFVVVMASEIIENLYFQSPIKSRLKTKLTLFKKATFKDAKTIFPISNYSKMLLIQQGIPVEKIKVTYGGADMDKFNPGVDFSEVIRKYNLKGKKIVLSVSRLDHHKGIDLVIKAFPSVLLKVPSVIYLVVGSGPERRKLESLVNTLKLKESVIFTGEILPEETPKYYNACDVFVMPSNEIKGRVRVEGFGIAYVEASACGKPVIGGRSGGVSDAIVDGETGILVDPFDIEQLSDNIIKFLTDKEYAEMIGQNGRFRVEKELNWKNIAFRIKAIMDLV